MRPEDEILFLALAINGEAGELAEHVKKLYRDGDYPNVQLSAERRRSMLKELGDKMYYIDRAAKFLGSSLEEVAGMNIKKLADRKARGVMGGVGDER